MKKQHFAKCLLALTLSLCLMQTAFAQTTTATTNTAAPKSSTPPATAPEIASNKATTASTNSTSAKAPEQSQEDSNSNTENEPVEEDKSKPNGIADDDEKIVPAPVFLSYKDVKDNFGRRIADSFMVVQVTVQNENDKQFIVQDVQIALDPNQCAVANDFYKDFNVEECKGVYDKYFKYPIVYSPTDRNLLMGVSKVGQYKNPRSFFFRVLEFAGSFGTSLTGFNFIGRDGKAGIGILRGSFLDSTKNLIPADEAEKMNNLSENSYIANVIIESKQAKTFNVFIPTDRFFYKDTWKLYKQPPRKESIEAFEFRRLMQFFVIASVYGVHIESKVGGGEGSGSGLRAITDSKNREDAKKKKDGKPND